MKDAELFPTICGYHWLPVFAKRPRVNALSLQIHELTKNHPALQRKLKDSPSRLAGEPTPYAGSDGQLCQSDPDAGVADQTKGQQA